MAFIYPLQSLDICCNDYSLLTVELVTCFILVSKYKKKKVGEGRVHFGSGLRVQTCHGDRERSWRALRGQLMIMAVNFVLLMKPRTPFIE